MQTRVIRVEIQRLDVRTADSRKTDSAPIEDDKQEISEWTKRVLDPVDTSLVNEEHVDK